MAQGHHLHTPDPHPASADYVGNPTSRRYAASLLGQLHADYSLTHPRHCNALPGMLQSVLHESSGAHRGLHEAQTLQRLQIDRVCVYLVMVARLHRLCQRDMPCDVRVMCNKNNYSVMVGLTARIVQLHWHGMRRGKSMWKILSMLPLSPSLSVCRAIRVLIWFRHEHFCLWACIFVFG